MLALKKIHNKQEQGLPMIFHNHRVFDRQTSQVVTLSLGLGLALFVLGCSGEASDPDAPISPPVQQVAITEGDEAKNQITAAGMSVEFPEGWEIIDLTQGDIDAILDEAFGDNPEWKQMSDMVRQAAAAGIIKFMVFDSNEFGKDFVPNANLVVVPAEKGMTLEKAIEENARELKAIAAQDSEVTAEPISLPGGEFGEFNAIMAFPVGRVSTNSFLALHRNQTFVLTFSAPEAARDEYSKIASDCMKTFRFVE